MSDHSTEFRRLAAIMFTDMVGYSALSQRNEKLAIELLEEHRQLLRSVFPKHQGQEIKSTGDGFLVEFASALAAVQCAVEIQTAMRQRNAGRSIERRVLIRIGIHLGDIVRRENDVFGDGVNIAARIEPLAEPGGICVSRAVYEQIENKVDHALVQLDRPQLKNIQATVEVYRLLLDEARAPWTPPKTARSRVMIAAALALIAAIAVYFILKSGRPPQSASPGTNTTTNATAPLVPWKAELKTLYAFGPTNTEGVTGWGPLTLSSDGFLYGCTIQGGPLGRGSLYRIRTNGSDYKVLRLFDPAKDGAQPLGGVIEGKDGALYGTTFFGGESNAGTIFRITKDGSDYRVLRPLATSLDARNSHSELLEAKDGLLYGTGSAGGGHALGGVFRIAKDGSEHKVVSGLWHNQPDDPRSPVGGLVQTTDGVLYGTTKFGGLKTNGTVYRLETNGIFTVIRNFGLVDGDIMQPEATLLLASDGMLYGTCTVGGPSGYGAVFRFAPDGGNFQVIRMLGLKADEAREPRKSLIEAPDGSLLGTSRIGGTANSGTIFRISKDGQFYQTLYNFTGARGEGARLQSPLTRGSPTVYYGTTAGGGNGNLGTVFQLTISMPDRPATNTTPRAAR